MSAALLAGAWELTDSEEDPDRGSLLEAQVGPGEDVRIIFAIVFLLCTFFLLLS